MSILDKIVAAVTPPESDETRMNARAAARAKARPGDWLGQVLDHHDAIEAAFETVRVAQDATQQRAAQKNLAVILTGHSNAEEAVIYPALADNGEKAHAGLAYEEQAAAKIQMALLEKLEPLSEEFFDKLEHIRGAVTHHMYQEESSWFLDLIEKVPAEEQAMLARRYEEETSRYLRDPAVA
ncbi:MAG: hemerythrin domain-containing protein [Pseudomonas sp.]|uniref:hemerythrin domain-containing protein n=1 Tax=Pseudomonas sp. TaxID=306 RepID=UPI00121FAB65|nr:hemerythrin domain-containing protein [Pseudomonas sp.]RZI76705.1 MAG: hemerythrin domain-containing protein [Pseudomonas sp.]